MSKNSYNEMIQQINEAQMQLKIRLEQVSKLRTDCAKLQLELLKLYKPECLEILEMLKIFESVDSFGSNDDNVMKMIEKRDNDQGNEVLRTDEDVSRKSTT
ncbi:uncharacterized protein LOC105426463 [Pogonomyrmex barbatus]|uniref:Uncharacterized protein LOC105426463 n=1 Tax=Pogonomyrmex barbatus TaxID=144034 RepID=A0A6I9WAW9_9HYME|nr:uncharacterized protein LOC105426463 [Pogonomyrmex barbatus]